MEMFRVEFFVEDKNLARAKRALAGIAMELKDIPVVNAKKGVNGKVSPEITNGDLVKLFSKYLSDQKFAKISAAHAKGFLQAIGRPDSNYGYLLKKSVEYKILSKVGKGSGTRYKVNATRIKK